jgi:uncharacterized protein
MAHKYTNDLINASSPYLLQHAHNPVNWQEWDNNLQEKAEKENKLLLISIGYSACHWCHVMEHECFEDEQVAGIMNQHFICIKVDREERPDIDHYYITSIQFMGIHGGWPLNIIALPDGKPLWGGTYFSRVSWMRNISSVYEFYSKNRNKAVEYSEKVHNGVQQESLLKDPGLPVPANNKIVFSGVQKWKEFFDIDKGGNKGYPKFPMPVSLEFLLCYGYTKNDSEVIDHVLTTLEKIAMGGIRDHLGGGFSRYSVDDKWKVPHFEKMLYDNGQLLSIYSKAFRYNKREIFKEAVYETVEFLKREMADSNGSFYSSLDADSEGVEGKYYLWKENELKSILGDDFDLFAEYFTIIPREILGNESYILWKSKSDEEFISEKGVTKEILFKKTGRWKQLLLQEREKRARPFLDDKVIISWNALVIQGLADAYKAFGDKSFRGIALKNARFIKENVMQTGGKLFHCHKKGNNLISGFLEDYALLIQSFISLFEITGAQEWIDDAHVLAKYTIQNFYDGESGMFFYSEEKNNKDGTGNYIQIEDNVIPASNSVMALNLHKLYLIYSETEYLNIIKKMLQRITSRFVKYPMALPNWGLMMLNLTEPYFEIVICGKGSEKKFLEMQNEFIPNALWAFSEDESTLPIFKDRYAAGKSQIYICREGSCLLPLTDVVEALELLKKQ